MKRIDRPSLIIVACAFLAMAPRALAGGGEDSRELGLAQADSGRAAPESTVARAKRVETVRVEETGMRFGAGDLREPIGLAADPRGYVYVADAMAGKVFRYEVRGGGNVAGDTASAGASAAGPALEFSRPPDVPSIYPIDVAVQESFVYVLDYAWNRLLRYDYKGAYYDVLISFADRGRKRPVSVTGGSGGRLVTTDVEASEVVLWNPLLDIELEISGFGKAPGSLDAPRKAAFLPDQSVVVAESGNARLQLFSPSGSFEGIAPRAQDPPFRAPRCVAADGRGTIFVCDPEAKRLSIYSSGLAHAGDIDSFAGERIVPAAVSTGWDDKLYVADLASRSILVYRIVYSEGP